VGISNAKQVVDLKTGRTRPARQKDYITKTLAVDRMGDSSKATRWQAFLTQVFNNDVELIDWIQRWCGYVLTGSTTEQIMVFAYGIGANGKSVFAEVLKFIVGDYGRAIAVETLQESKRGAGAATPDLFALVGARLALSTETSEGAALAETLIKNVVSGDSMTARDVFSGQVEFTPAFKLLMLGNHKPIIRGTDNGIWRRVCLLPFNRVFAPHERDKNLLDTLKTEAPDILAWMVEGAMRWGERGLSEVPASIETATAEYRIDMDIVGSWVTDNILVDARQEESASRVYADYKNWSLDNGLKPSSSKLLGRRLSERGFTTRKSNGKTFYQGLTLANTNAGAWQ
jgi:P4 family phage/plasmid primase-like protien